MRQLTEDVEVVIVDGASSDTTPSVIRQYSSRYPQVRYIRKESNGGVDRDFCEAVEHARGAMCWLFADDDVLKPEAVSTVLEEVRKGYSLIIVNAEVRNRDLSQVIASKLLNVQQNRVYDPSELTELFQDAVECMSFIGGVVIDRQVWLTRDKESYLGSDFVHVGVVFQAPLPGRALVIAASYIEIRLGNAQWTPRAFEIWMIKWPRLLSSFVSVSVNARRNYKAQQSARRLKNLMVHRAKGEYSRTEYARWLASESCAPWWRVSTFLVSVMPPRLARAIILTYLGIRNREALAWWRSRAFSAL